MNKALNEAKIGDTVIMTSARDKVGEASRCLNSMIDGINTETMEGLPEEVFNTIGRVQDDLCWLFDKLPSNLVVMEVER